MIHITVTKILENKGMETSFSQTTVSLIFKVLIFVSVHFLLQNRTCNQVWNKLSGSDISEHKIEAKNY
jgi:hypothetical protein